MPDIEAIEREVDANYEAFVDRIDRLIEEGHEEQYALLHNTEIVEFHDDMGLAVSAGLARYPDHVFSVQQVTKRVMYMGFYSHVDSVEAV